MLMTCVARFFKGFRLFYQEMGFDSVSQLEGSPMTKYPYVAKIQR